MAIEIVLNEMFVDGDGNVASDFDVDGYQFSDFFADDGYVRAYEAHNKQEADAILTTTYKGRDTDGIGVVWKVEESF